MTETPTPADVTDAVEEDPIGYASPTTDLPADRLLRRIVACTAILDGGAAVIGLVVHIALAKGWLASPNSMSWEFDGLYSIVSMGISMALAGTTLLGGLLLLRRKPVSIVLLRSAAIASLVFSLFGYVMLFHDNPTWATYWSTFGAAVSQALGMLRGLWVPVLIGLLTLPPLARRMV